MFSHCISIYNVFPQPCLISTSRLNAIESHEILILVGEVTTKSHETTIFVGEIPNMLGEIIMKSQFCSLNYYYPLVN